MRICLYTHTALPKLGGQELVVDALARQFLELGHEPAVLAPWPKPPLAARDAELPYRVVRHPRFVSTRRFVAWYRHWLIRLHRQTPLDVVHCHSVYPCGYLAALAKNRIGAPLVVTSHGGDVRPGNARLLKRGLRTRHELAVQSADRLVSIGRFTSDGFRLLGATDSQIVDLPNGVDLAPFAKPAPRPAGLPEDISAHDYVLFLGRLHHRKGIDLLVRAWRAVLARVPNARLIVAGDGDERAALESLAESMGVAERIIFFGAVRGDAKTWLLQNARCVVLPSRQWEAFPLVVLEAFAAGRPVVASDAPGLVDRVDHAHTGLLVPQEDAGALGEALVRLLIDREAADRMGAAAAHLAKNYSWRSIAERHLELYRQVSRGRQAA